jgi:addiction module HigA family antidote
MSKQVKKRLANDMIPGDIFHPGEFIKDEMEARKMTQQQLADKMQISKSEMSLLLNGHRNITPLIAIKLEKIWGIDAEFWMNLQVKFDIDTLKKKYKQELKKTRISLKKKSKLRKLIAAA